MSPIIESSMDKNKTKKDADAGTAKKSIQKTVKSPKILDRVEDFAADCITHRKQ